MGKNSYNVTYSVAAVAASEPQAPVVALKTAAAAVHVEAVASAVHVEAVAAIEAAPTAVVMSVVVARAVEAVAEVSSRYW